MAYSITLSSQTMNIKKKGRKRMHLVAHLGIKVNQVKSLLRTFCSFESTHRMRSHEPKDSFCKVIV